MSSFRRIILVSLVSVSCAAANSWAGTVDLPQTGQVCCHDATGEPVVCNSTGHDGNIQAGALWPSSRFTSAGDATILIDNLTGLMWTRDADLPGGKRTWSDAQTFVAGMSVGGFNDWRLPNANELESLVNTNEPNTGTWLLCEGFTNVRTGVNDFYWGSTWRDPGMPDVFTVDMALGTLVPGNTQNDLNYVWAVRAGQTGSADPTYDANLWVTGQTFCYDVNGQQIACAGTRQDGDAQAGVAWPNPRFVDNLDGTVTDNLTGLMWSKDGNLPVTARMWQDALNYAAGLSLGGHTDWRLPNRKELRSLVNYENPLPGALTTPAAWLNTQGFINAVEDNYWSSSTIVALPNMGWRITMADKELAASGKNENHYVWPVRLGTVLPAADIAVTDTVAPSSDLRLGFGSVALGGSSDHTVTVTNDGSLNLDIGSVALTDPLALPFSIVADNCSGQLLSTAGSCTVVIRFAPTVAGTFAETFDIPSNDSNESPVTVELSGTDPSAAVSSGILQLSQTGQTTSFRTSDDGDIESGRAWPSPRFTDNTNGTQTDELTGLMWTQDANLSAGTMSWPDALTYVAGLNTGGHNDWRLPNLVELESLVHAGQTDTAAWLATQNFTNVQPSQYWSSTSDTLFPEEANTVNMSDGDLFRGLKDGDTFSVWPVRAGQTGGSPDPTYPANLWKTGQDACYDDFGSTMACAGTGQDGETQAGVSWPSPRFMDNADGTVTDQLTGLMWTRDASPFGISDWPDAVDDAAGLSLAGHTDWRLPNRRELLSLVDASEDSPALPAGHPFTNVQLDFYWSATTRAPQTNFAWILAMEEGFVGWVFKATSDYYAWPVRSPAPPDTDGDSVPDAADCAPLDGSIWQVPGVVLETLTWDAGKTTLSWECIAQATLYNVYRGTFLAGGLVYDHTCFEDSDDDAFATDAGIPAVGQGWYYLVSGENACGEGGLGRDSAGGLRPNSTPCP